MTPEDQFDDRLRAYLRQRADVPTPPDLLTNAETAGRSHPAPARPRLRLAVGLAAIAMGAVFIASRILFALAPVVTVPGASSPAPSPVSGATPNDSSLATAGFPAEVLGLPVISVPDARVLIAGGRHQGRAMAVGGWWSEGMLAMGCPASPVYTSVVQGYCSATALAPTDAQVDHFQQSDNGSSESFQRPADALSPREGPETAGIDEPNREVANDPAARQLPRRVVLVGHVGDPRAWQCVADAFVSCQKEFVVDAFAWVEGRFIDAWNDRGGPAPHLTVAQARDAAQSAMPGSRLVTISPWDEGEVPSLDPRIGLSSGAFWLARSIAGAPDPQGTAPLVEALIDDRIGAARTLSMSFAPGTEPGAVQFVADGNFFEQNGQLPALYAAVVDNAGKRLQQTYFQSLGNTPAVLSQGDYTVISWSGDPNTQVPNPTPPARVSCSGSVHVQSNVIASVTITWRSDLTCQVRGALATPTTAP
jgi:hypothetical protein